MKTKVRIARASIIAMTTVSLSLPARAQAPALVPVQGQLSDGSGVPIDGSPDLDFAVYDAAIGGNAVYTAAFPAHPVVGGAFAVHLGADSALDLATFRDESDLWIQIAVDGEVLSPRVRLASVPFSGHAAHGGDAAALEGQAASSFAPAGHGHDWSDVANFAPHLADGDADTLAVLGATCAGGNSLVQWDGTQWVCGPIAFESLGWQPGYAFLTTALCPVGFTAVEAGYLKLSSSPSLTPSARTLSTPAHFHSLGTAAVSNAGAHQHDFSDQHEIDSGNSPEVASSAGDDVGSLADTPRTSAVAGAHPHGFTGSFGAAASGANGDAPVVAIGDLEHVALRMCVKE